MGLRDQLENQQLATHFGGENQRQTGAMRILNFSVPVNTWLAVLPINTGRRFLTIQNVGGDSGACRVEMSLDTQNRNAVFEIDSFEPRFVPTNAIYIYVSDPLLTGSTVVNIQVIEG